MIAWPKGSQPHIQPNHVDGPVLHMRTGEIHWLGLWERIQLAFGWTDEFKLERKHSELLGQVVSGPREGWDYAELPAKRNPGGNENG